MYASTTSSRNGIVVSAPIATVPPAKRTSSTATPCRSAANAARRALIRRAASCAALPFRALPGVAVGRAVRRGGARAWIAGARSRPVDVDAAHVERILAERSRDRVDDVLDRDRALRPAEAAKRGVALRVGAPRVAVDRDVGQPV